MGGGGGLNFNPDDDVVCREKRNAFEGKSYQGREMDMIFKGI
jgi:hypothetical protein